MLVNLDYKGYLDVLSSNEPAPGGGSVSALSGGLAVSLLQMVCNLSIGKKGLEEYQELYIEILKETNEYKEFFIKSVDEDSDAFNLVIEAFRLPKITDEEKKHRSEMIQKGYKRAANVPLNVGLKAYDFIKYQEKLVDNCNQSAITDIFVSALQTRACIEGAFANVYINLSSIKDEMFVKEYKDKMTQILEDSEKRINEIKQKIEKVIL